MSTLESTPTTDDLRRLLKRGLFVANLHEMTRCCMALARSVKEPLPYYVLASIFSDLAANWDDRPLPVEEAKNMENHIGPDLNGILTILLETGSTIEVADPLNALVKKFVQAPI